MTAISVAIGANARPAIRAVSSVATVPSTPAGANDQTIPLSGMRRLIAERLLASKTQLPHFYLHIEIDAAPLMKLRASILLVLFAAAVAASFRGEVSMKVDRFNRPDFVPPDRSAPVPGA